MKHYTAILTAGIGLTLSPMVQAKQKPNIVFIFADDLGWKDVGYNGNDYYETPNIDKLAANGMVFTNGYASAANCAPSRASLMSGQYSPRHGVFAVGSTDRGPKKLMRLTPYPNNETLATDKITMAEALQKAGYATGCFGKWHLGDETDKADPLSQGFDVYFDSRKDDPNKKRDMPDDPKGIYSNTKAACDFMESNSKKPFFVYLSQHAIHSSQECRPSSLQKFKNKQKGTEHNNALYAGCVFDLDDAVDIVLKKINALGLTKNTLVVFTSDNGGVQQSTQEPLRGNKGCYYDGGIREPFIMYWPGKIKPGTTCDIPVINEDLYPTFLSVAMAEPEKGYTLDGENIMPLAFGKGVLKRESIFWHFPGYLDNPVIRGRDNDFRTRPTTVIRKGDWKLHLFYEEWMLDGGMDKIATNNSVELYNMKEDIGERVNLANANPQKRDELLGDLLKWLKETKAPLPSVK